MNGKLTNGTKDQVLINGVSEAIFNELKDDQRNIVLSGNNDVQNKSKDGGVLGKWLGTNPRNASIHIALILCIILLLFCGLDLIHSFGKGNTINSEIWNSVMPIITLALGYVFGKGENN